MTLSAALLGVLVSGCASVDLSHPVVGATTVAIGEGFGPGAISVAAGTTVTWVWQDGRLHDVHGPDFESAYQSTGQYAVRFDRPGTYSYVCDVHPGMVGQVVVTP